MTAASKASVTSWRSFRTLQVCLGLLLLTAAALKTHQLVTEPTLETGILDSRWFLMAVVEFEFFLAIWIFAGLLPVWTWRASIALFAVFSLVTLYKAVSGEASCGCFGRVSISPWFTFTLDVFVLAALLVCRPAAQNGQRNAHDSYVPGFDLAMLLGAWLLVAVPAAGAIASYEPAALGHAGEILGDGRTVLLEPEDWVGMRFPLLDWIETNARLDHGQWTIILYRPGCRRCDELLRRYQMGAGIGRSERVAFIEIAEPAPHGAGEVPEGASFFAGRLNRRFEWFVETPTRIVVDDEEVRSVVCEEKDV